MEQMRRIRMMEPPFVPNDEEHGEDVAGTAVEDAVQSRERRRFSERAVLMAVRLLIISSFFLLLSFGFEENMLMDLSDHASRSIGSVKAATTHEATSNKAAIIQVAVNKAATDEAQREASLQPIAFASTGEGLAGDDEKSPQAELADEPAEGLPDQTNPVLDPLPSADIEKDYEVFEIEGDKSFYKLPKEYVALTFDDGPSAFTEKIVDILAEQDVAATFLFVGRNVARRPEAVIYASRHGMSIGNHSWDHRELTKLSPADQAENIAKASSVLESLTHVPVTLFRPPYGSINDSLYSKAKEQHMRILMWNRDPEDWNAKKPDEIVKYFHECDASGGVFVLHEDMMTLEALPDIIKYLKGKNLKFATFK
jgi:peptidoglycan/xylan/chitin deacetylase (PgdA/CDA1 family)